MIWTLGLVAAAGYVAYKAFVHAEDCNCSSCAETRFRRRARRDTRGGKFYDTPPVEPYTPKLRGPDRPTPGSGRRLERRVPTEDGGGAPKAVPSSHGRTGSAASGRELTAQDLEAASRAPDASATREEVLDRALRQVSVARASAAPPVVVDEEEERFQKQRRRTKDIQIADASHDPQYLHLKATVETLAQEMKKAFEDSRSAFTAGHHDVAKQRAERGRRLRQRMETTNNDAAEYIFQAMNKQRPAGEIDLHYQYVDKAILLTAAAVADAYREGRTKLEVIVGKGKGSADGVRKIAPAVQEFLERADADVSPEPGNDGKLIARLKY